MKIDGGIGTQDIKKAGDTAARQEEAGYDGLWTAETSHDPFLPLTLAAERTDRVELGTSIAVAFARNPMLLANIGWDLQSLSDGRFILGLGSQIKPHITKRFSMEWSRPAARMREMVQAIHAIWDTWLTGDKLDFRGDFYTHTIMTPFFTPQPGELGDFGRPKIFLAGVGPLMTEVAGEVCDGFICHGFTTEQFLREVTIPALEKGRAKAGKTMDGFETSARHSWCRARMKRNSRRQNKARVNRLHSTDRLRRTSRCSTSTAGAMYNPNSTGCRKRANGSRWETSSPTRSSTPLR